MALTATAMEWVACQGDLDPSSETKALEGHSKPVVDTQLLYRITPGWGKVVARCRGQCVYGTAQPSRPRPRRTPSLEETCA